MVVACIFRISNWCHQFRAHSIPFEHYCFSHFSRTGGWCGAQKNFAHRAIVIRIQIVMVNGSSLSLSLSLHVSCSALIEHPSISRFFMGYISKFYNRRNTLVELPFGSLISQPLPAHIGVYPRCSRPPPPPAPIFARKYKRPSKIRAIEFLWHNIVEKLKSHIAPFSHPKHTHTPPEIILFMCHERIYTHWQCALKNRTPRTYRKSSNTWVVCLECRHFIALEITAFEALDTIYIRTVYRKHARRSPEHDYIDRRIRYFQQF